MGASGGRDQTARALMLVRSAARAIRDEGLKHSFTIHADAERRPLAVGIESGASWMQSTFGMAMFLLSASAVHTASQRGRLLCAHAVMPAVERDLSDAGPKRLLHSGGPHPLFFVPYLAQRAEGDLCICSSRTTTSVHAPPPLRTTWRPHLSLDAMRPSVRRSARVCSAGMALCTTSPEPCGSAPWTASAPSSTHQR